MTEDSLKKRYSYKLLTNLVGLVFNLISYSIIPRGLGPKAYGSFNFLTNFFSQMVGFLDTGTSLGFYTKLSKRPSESALVSFYAYFVAIVSLLIFVFVLFTEWTDTYERIWPDQEMAYIYLAAGLGILTWVVGILNMTADAYGITVATEKARIIQRVVGLILICLLFTLGQLHLYQFFIYQYFILIFLTIAFVWVMNKNGYPLNQTYKALSWFQIRQYSKEFYHYSHPLFFCSVLGLIAGIFDRWLLQVFGGSIQQGFYGLSYQIGAICFLFTGAMSPLLTREFAISFAKSDLREMARLFRRYVPMLYVIAAFFSCFIALQAQKVIYIMGGHQFSGASLAVAIMAFYPIHQTYGQISGSVYFAAGQTALYRNIGITFLLIGLPLTYFLIAPKEKMGLGAGATGLAIKMVLMNFIGVNVQVYFNAKLLNLNFWRYFGHQLAAVGCLLLVAAVAIFGADNILGLHERIIASFLVSGILYTVVVMSLACFLPVLFGINKEDIHFIQSKIKSLVKWV